ncbi:hypothetical protein FEM48_Zijuj12G0171700 [Ziziphus jujuba var. spinosa]|uniref:Senescence regulator S40 n=1 Tax=Ziziphus jujuba var. spinosa TaxID=714518 RepID=A0A978UEL2_ZIZJJ|nr:hypothetical protein FEM48_Zijuj12G0171700 [Ziziphus jujuba var. spinosa]
MGSRKIFHAKPSYIFPTSSIRENPVGSDTLYEFEESDIWNSKPNSDSNTVSALDQPKKSIPMRDPKKLGSRKISVQAERTTSSKVTSASLPMNIPDWSKILKDDYKEPRRRESDDDFEDGDDDDNDDESERMPPHEYLARKRGASLSVHEGIGRTLKGRDLRRVRNAIWKKTGFED